MTHRVRSVRHPFKPKTDDPCRCAYCLHLLDCAPHLPLAPTPTWPATGSGNRIRILHGNPPRTGPLYAAIHSPVAAVQGER